LGGSGDATVTGTEWRVTSLPLKAGANDIRITATGNDGLSASAALSVIQEQEAAGDLVAPSVYVQSPAGPLVVTTQSKIVFTGTASDAGGVAGVTWETNTGGRGDASPVVPSFAQWRAEVTLAKGFNTVTIRARDRAGNTGWRTVSVTRR
jgi:hypothetical protein